MECCPLYTPLLRHMVGVEVRLHSYLPLTLDQSGQDVAAALPPRNERQVCCIHIRNYSDRTYLRRCPVRVWIYVTPLLRGEGVVMAM